MFCAKTLSWLRITSGLAIGSVLCAGAWAAAEPDVTVSQRNRSFNPGDIALSKGQALVIVNDDGDLLHHAYVESEDFNFDSGDQQPGSRARVVFPTSGDYKVLCGIHPKMKLTVHVR